MISGPKNKAVEEQIWCSGWSVFLQSTIMGKAAVSLQSPLELIRKYTHSGLILCCRLSFSAWKMALPGISNSLKPIHTSPLIIVALLRTEGQTIGGTKDGFKTLLLFLGTKFSSCASAFALNVLTSCRSCI